jgi:ERCC4-type nuclease
MAAGPCPAAAPAARQAENVLTNYRKRAGAGEKKRCGWPAGSAPGKIIMDNEFFPPLPALRHLGDLADRLPTVIIDSREQDPLPLRRLPVIRAGLYSGDYSVNGLQDVFAVERKTVDDLASCCSGDNRERFERELHRLRGYRFKRLLVIGQRVEIELKRYRSSIAPAAVLGTLSAFEVRYDCPVVWAPTPEAGAELVERWAWYAAREAVEQVNALYRHSTSMEPKT